MREYLANHEDQEHNELEEEFEKDDLINLPSYENNERYRRWITIMKLIFAALAGLADFIIARMILSKEIVDCILDRGMEWLGPLNSYINSHHDFSSALQITSSLWIDFSGVIVILNWVFNTRSSRLILTLIFFFALRQITQYLFVMTLPEGFYWNYPGFPSLFVPYGMTTDFIYSGHVGILIICMMESWTLKKRKLAIFICVGALYMSFVLLSFRNHYSVDLIFGVTMAHYFFILSARLAPYCDKLLKRIFDICWNRFLISKKISKDKYQPNLLV